MVSLFAKLLGVALAILFAPYIIPGISVTSFYTALIVAVILSILNLLVKPILVLLTLPLNLITLGFFTLVINAFLFWFVGTIVKGFVIEGFMAAFLGALFVSAISFIFGKLF